jgi:hypothetical protein
MELSVHDYPIEGLSPFVSADLMTPFLLEHRFNDCVRDYPVQMFCLFLNIRFNDYLFANA